MIDRVGDQLGDRDVQEKAELASQHILAAVSVIERSSPAVLREIRDNLEIEIMIDRVGRPRRRLLRLVSEYCDRRIREKERDSGYKSGAGVPSALRSLISARSRSAAPPGRAS